MTEVSQADMEAADAVLLDWPGLAWFKRPLVRVLARHAASAREEALKEAAALADEYTASCAQARGNAGAQNDRHAVWQAEAERLASMSIASMIRSLSIVGEGD